MFLIFYATSATTHRFETARDAVTWMWGADMQAVAVFKNSGNGWKKVDLGDECEVTRIETTLETAR